MVPWSFNTETVLKEPDSAGIGLCNTEENEEQEGRGVQQNSKGPGGQYQPHKPPKKSSGRPPWPSVLLRSPC